MSKKQMGFFEQLAAMINESAEELKRSEAQKHEAAGERPVSAAKQSLGNVRPVKPATDPERAAFEARQRERAMRDAQRVPAHKTPSAAAGAGASMRHNRGFESIEDKRDYQTALEARAKANNRSLSSQRSYEMEQAEVKKRHPEADNEGVFDENDWTLQSLAEEAERSGIAPASEIEVPTSIKMSQAIQDIRTELSAGDRRRAMRKAIVWQEILLPPKSRR